MEYIAVIDTETNWYNEVMSIGVAIADKTTFDQIDGLYYVFTPEYKVGGIFSAALPIKERSGKDVLVKRETAMEKIRNCFAKYNIEQIYAYNANFDKNLLKELTNYQWFDIMRIAAYRQYNDRIPANAECCKTGKMKRNYGVEPMMQILSGNKNYIETHNAYYDAGDELLIMKLLGKNCDTYAVARI